MVLLHFSTASDCSTSGSSTAAAAPSNVLGCLLSQLCGVLSLLMLLMEDESAGKEGEVAGWF